MNESTRIHIIGERYLDPDEVEISFMRSPGPGGQKVNKTESAVQVRFNARTSPILNSAMRLRLKQHAGRRMTKDGVIVITANRFRTQEQNRQDAMGRLVELLRKAATPPKYRRPTKPSKAAKKRRLESKSRRGDIKKMRSRVRDSD